MLDEIKNFSPREQCKTLKRLLEERTKSMHCYKEQLDEKTIEVNETVKECNRRIKEVRAFWKDKIYDGKTRSGRILKSSLLKQ